MELKWNEIEYKGTIYDISRILIAMKKYGVDHFEAEIETGSVAANTSITTFEVDEFHALIKAKYPSVEHLIVDAPVKVEVNVPRCPTCGSTNLTKKGVGARAIDGFFFGRLSVEGRSQFRCQNCGYEW